MKKTAVALSVAALALYCALVSVVVLSPLNPYGDGKWLTRGCDYMMRMTEIDCLLRGANPYDVWHGNIVLKPYVPNYGEARAAVEGKEGYTEEINAYAPWEYIMMMPFALMPRTFSWILYFALMLASLSVLFRIGRSFTARFAGVVRDNGAVVGTAAILLAGLPIYQNFQSGNLAVPVLVAAALMAYCLNHGQDELAGVCWAFVMLKPNLGLAFAIPLLMRRKFLTCVVAASLCAILTLAASLVCGSSPFDMVLQTPAANTFAFMGCGTFPYFLCQYLPGDYDIIAGLAVGAVLCFFMTFVLVRAGYRDWIVLSMPAAVVGAAWSYSQCYCFAMNWFFFVVLAASLMKCPRSKFLWSLAILSALLMTRLYNLGHTLTAILAGPGFDPASPTHYNVDSLVTSAGLVLTVALCCWVSRQRPRSGRG